MIGVGTGDASFDSNGRPLYKNRRQVISVFRSLPATAGNYFSTKSNRLLFKAFAIREMTCRFLVDLLLSLILICLRAIGLKIIFFMLQVNTADRALITAFREIGQMADRLNLPRMIPVSLLICLFILKKILHISSQ